MAVGDANSAVESLVSRLRRRQLKGSYKVAVETCLVLRQVVSQTRWTHIDQLITQIRNIGVRTVEAQPREFTSGNIVRRVLKLIREEYAEELESLEQGDSVASLEEQNVPVDPNTSIHSSILNLLGKPDVLVPSTNTNSRHAVGAELKPNIIAGIQEIMDELKKIYDDISAHALDHIHSSEIILTHGSSQTVSSFLVTAAEKRKFTVIVTEAYPNDIDASHAMADKLAKAGINVILVPDSAVFGLMSRVNKVIMSTHAVLANGGLLASAGAQMVAQAARVHATPVVVVTGVYKVSPVYPYDVESLIELADPGKVLSFSEGDLIDGVDVCNPYYDYVSPDMVDLYITNLGGHPPTFLNRIVAEQYDAQDTVL